MRSWIRGQQECCAKWTRQLNTVTLVQITNKVGADAPFIPLDRKGQIIETRAFAITRTRHRIKTWQMWIAITVYARWDDAYALPFQHRKWEAAQIKDDVTYIAAAVGVCQAIVTLNQCGSRLAQVVHVDGGLSRCCWGLGLTACPCMGLGKQLGDHVVLVVVPICGCYNVSLVWQFFPTKLFFDGVRRIHHPPFINRTRWAD